MVLFSILAALYLLASRGGWFGMIGWAMSFWGWTLAYIHREAREVYDAELRWEKPDA